MLTETLVGGGFDCEFGILIGERCDARLNGSLDRTDPRSDDPNAFPQLPGIGEGVGIRDDDGHFLNDERIWFLLKTVYSLTQLKKTYLQLLD